MLFLTLAMAQTDRTNALTVHVAPTVEGAVELDLSFAHRVGPGGFLVSISRRFGDPYGLEVPFLPRIGGLLQTTRPGLGARFDGSFTPPLGGMLVVGLTEPSEAGWGLFLPFLTPRIRGQVRWDAAHWGVGVGVQADVYDLWNDTFPLKPVVAVDGRW